MNNLLGSLGAITLLASSVATASQTESLPRTAAEASPTAWFVQLESKPGSSSKSLNSERKAFREAMKSAGISYKERRNFEKLWNGLSIDISAEDANKIKSFSGIKGVWPVVKFDMPVIDATSSPDLISAIKMTGADIAQNSLGYKGEGIKVAIMDTGIDVDSEDFGGDGVARNDSSLFPSERVAYGYDFVGDAYDARFPETSTPMPDDNPDDCQGHGTHVAGIVGANGPTIKGVAPEVTLGAYRVFGCDGSTDADIMIAAMEMALEDGMDVLNMSIGSSFQWPQYPTAVAASNLVDQGMVVVASIGNSGTSGLYAAGAPGLGEKVIGVASIDNTEVLSSYFEVNGQAVTYSSMSFAGDAPTSGSSEYAYVGLACNGMPLEADVTGITALISRGGCAFRDKAVNAINAGATAVIVHNSSSGGFNGTLGTPIDGATPVVGISLEDGEFMRAQLAGSTVNWSDSLISAPNPTGGLISSFSSFGLSPDLALKPDISAPGGAIYSTYPLEKGGHATLGGTSMASPHVAGAAALVLQAKPNTPAGEMRALLQNSSDPASWSLNPQLGLPDHVHRQGSGMVDIDDAILATTIVTPGKIATGESDSGPHTETLTVRNDGTESITYNLYHQWAISTSGVTDVTGYYGSDASVVFSQPSITVESGSSASFDATINPATGPAPDGLYGGYIVLVPQDGGEVIRVPYAGFVGDYQSIQHMTPGDYGMPWLTYLEGGLYNKVNFAEDHTFTMEGDDIAYFLVHFDHQAEYFEANIYHAETGELVHPVFYHAFVNEYLPRNDAQDGFFEFSWDGTRLHSNGSNGKGNDKQKRKTLENGNYIVELRLLKANGDVNDPSHWETWTSPVVSIERP
ncbi:S8 family serine peptidase [Colwellia sp. MEBiC06753]